MDVKAMAKSKRSHTKHHQPRKHPHPSKPTPTPHSSSSTSADPKAQKSQGKERTRAVQPPSLPSNWDRYEDEGEGVAELSIDSNSDQPGRLADSKCKVAYDVVKPKSKGANFGELIAQARESRTSYSSSFLDTVPDFYQGLGPMLSVRGESILSLKEGDDFLADDEATTTREAPFLSLDLQDLAEQLAKVDLADRLFIEADLLPPELCDQGANKPDDQSFKKSEKQNKIRVPETFDELFALYLEEELNAEQDKKENIDITKSSLAVTGTIDSFPSSTPADVTDYKSDGTELLNAKESSLGSHIIVKDSKPSSRFKAAVAEKADLDMLLDSLSETKPFNSSASQSETATTKTQHKTLSLLEGNSVLDIPITSSLDDDLDNLLEQTSKQDSKGGLSLLTQTKPMSFDLPSSSSSSLNPSSKSKVLDDFDSWFDTI